MADFSGLGTNQAVVKNNRYNWDLINDMVDPVSVEREHSEDMVIEFPSNRSMSENLPMFQT